MNIPAGDGEPSDVGRIAPAFEVLLSVKTEGQISGIVVATSEYWFLRLDFAVSVGIGNKSDNITE